MMQYPIKPYQKAFIYTLLALLLSLIIGSFFFKIDIISQSSGIIIPSNKTQHVQHLEGGIVEAIYVKEGQAVDEDDLLVKLESVSIEAKIEQLALELHQMKASQQRLIAFINQHDMVLPKNDVIPEAIWKTEVNLFQTQLKQFTDNVSLKSLIIEQEKEQAAGLKKSVELLEQSLAYIDESLDISQSLVEVELNSRLEHLSQLEMRNKQANEFNEKKNAYQNSLQNIKLFTIDKELFITNFLENNQKELNHLKKKSKQLTEQLSDYQDQLERVEMRSPAEGIIQSITVNNSGEVILPGETVATITPTDKPLIIEARIPISDIGWIATNSQAKVRLPLNLSGRYKAVDATVTYISSDRVSDENTKQVYYKCNLETDQMYFNNNNDRYYFYPGMSVDVSFIIGTRSLLDYFIEPIYQHSYSKLSEP